MASVAKVSVSLSTEDLAWAQSRAKRLDRSLSSVVSEAIHAERQAEARRALLRELGASDISAHEVDALRREMGGVQAPARRRSTRAPTKPRTSSKPRK